VARSREKIWLAELPGRRQQEGEEARVRRQDKKSSSLHRRRGNETG
jgi:hypothetical protein